MTTRRDPDAILASWLEEGPDVLPESTRRAIEVAARTTHQSRHPKWMTWRFQNMNGMTRLALAGAAVVAVAVGGLYLFRPATDPSGGVGGPGSPAPSASPSPRPSTSASPLDTSLWTTYTSSRYGFSIGHPADWSEIPATHDWTLAADVDWGTDGAEAFGPDDIRMTAWSVATEPGMTVDAWLQAYCPLTTVNTGDSAAQCPTVIGKAAAATMDGHAGLLVAFPANTQAFFLVEDRLYIVAIWRPETHPSVLRYSGTRRLVETAISTMRLLPGGPAPASSAPPS